MRRRDFLLGLVSIPALAVPFTAQSAQPEFDTHIGFRYALYGKAGDTNRATLFVPKEVIKHRWVYPLDPHQTGQRVNSPIEYAANFLEEILRKDFNIKKVELEVSRDITISQRQGSRDWEFTNA